MSLHFEGLIHHAVSLQSQVARHIFRSFFGLFLIVHEKYLRVANGALTLVIALGDRRAEPSTVLLDRQSHDHRLILPLRFDSLSGCTIRRPIFPFFEKAAGGPCRSL